MTIIECPICGELCGKEYPDYFNKGGSWDQGFREGPGENFVYDDEWYCSQECMDEAKRQAYDHGIPLDE
jgi:hypothetical protein